jgi:hypothetical protein
MSQSSLSSSAPSRPGRSFTIVSYIFTVVSFAAPTVLAGAAIALGLIGASRGDDAGRRAAVVAGVVLVLQMAFFVLWAFGVIRLPL